MPYLQTRMDYAIRLFQTAEYEEAKIVFGQFLKLYKRESQPENIRLCLYRLACIAYIRGEMQNFHEILTHYQAYRQQEAVTIQDVEYQILLGLERLSLQRYEEAIHAFTHALPIAKKRELTEHKIISLLYIQRCHILLGHSDLSLEMSDELWTTYGEEIKAYAGHFFHYLLNRADTLHAFAHLEEMSELLKACETHEDLHIMPKEYAKTLLTRAKLHMAYREARPAMLALEKAVEIAEGQEDINLRSEVYELLMDSYESRGKTKQALRYAKKRLALHKKVAKK
jgi:tetratricopeptide (TPR) repeat protein